MCLLLLLEVGMAQNIPYNGIGILIIPKAIIVLKLCSLKVENSVPVNEVSPFFKTDHIVMFIIMAMLPLMHF